jgi:peptidoglycan hydrolase-like protein with peptidoglycan-binding domain
MKVFTRADWGAVPPRKVVPLDPSKVTKFVVHHTTGDHRKEDDSARWVRNIQHYHLNGKGWNDIAYSFLVDKRGDIYVGRGWQAVGGHTAGHNSTSIGVAFLGDGRIELPEPAKAAIAHLYAQARGLFGNVSPSCHNNWAQTQCPGSVIVDWVRAGLPVPKGRGEPLVVSQITAPLQTAQLWARDKGANVTFIYEIIPAIYQAAAQQAFINNGRFVDPIIAVAQSAKETGWGRFGGVLTAEWRNTAGIKTASGGGDSDPDAHQRFETWAEGARAQLNHLAAYVGLQPVGTPHARYWTVQRLSWAGSVQTVEELGSRWAPSGSYGTDIVRMVEEARSYRVEQVAPVVIENVAPATLPVLRTNSTGEAVRLLQEKLFVTGKFGAETEAAVRAFQRRHGLQVDGVVGPRTWAKLNEVA